MKQCTIDLIQFYKPLTVDWMNYKVTRNNPITFHHIVKAEHGGKYEINNGALITQVGHQYVHTIEYKEHRLYELLNKMFVLINKQRTPPTQEQRDTIEYILREFERLHRYDENKKGKNLIKPEFITLRSK